jgi:hypothetical protein
MGVAKLLIAQYTSSSDTILLYYYVKPLTSIFLSLPENEGIVNEVAGFMACPSP